MFPHYNAIVVCGIEGVEEFAEVPDPSGYLFSFNVCEGEGGVGNVELVCRYRPIQMEVEL